MSRTLLIFAEDHPIADDIFASVNTYHKDLAHDMACIATCLGQCNIDLSYRDAYNSWRKGGLLPAPSHPRLKHYCARRGAQLLKLSMVASVDRSDDLTLTEDDFHRALGWLTGAEALMPYVFSNISSVQTVAMEEALVGLEGKTVSEGQIAHFLSARIPASQVAYTVNVMVSMGRLVCVGVDDMRLRKFKVLKKT